MVTKYKEKTLGPTSDLRTMKNLLNCLSETSDAFPALSASDWRKAVSQSVKHGITPLIYRRVKHLGISEQVPPDVWTELEKYYFINLRNDLRAYADLKGYLKAFSANDVPVIVLKGAHLAELVYGNPGMRVFSDIDLLVEKEKFRVRPTYLTNFEVKTQPLIDPQIIPYNPPLRGTRITET